MELNIRTAPKNSIGIGNKTISPYAVSRKV
jgi:hypothetical protein